MTGDNEAELRRGFEAVMAQLDALTDAERRRYVARAEAAQRELDAQEAALRAELLAVRDALRRGDDGALRAALDRLGLARHRPYIETLTVQLAGRHAPYADR